MGCRRLAWLVIAVIAAGTSARADDKLSAARTAIDQVRYADAEPLLVAALREGTSSPERVLEIYRQLASTATVLGQRETAENYYRRWLALDPHASLPDTIAPKLREPFVTAQADMAARPRLATNARLVAGAVEVEVISDPLAMIAAVRVDAQPAQALVSGHARVDVAASAASVKLALLDEFGNHLVEITVRAEHVHPDRVDTPPTPPPLPFVRRPLPWAVGTVAFAAIGVGFAVAANDAQSDLDAILAHSSEHFLADAQAAQSRRDRDATVANVSFVAGGACAITAIVLSIVRPAGGVWFAPTARGAAVELTW